jgi:quercetin dioxygenase-like cupin family protein
MSPRIAAAILLALGVTASAGEPPAPAPILPGSLQWAGPPGNPAVEAAWVIGAEDRPGLYALRVRMQAGGRIPPHVHPDTRYTTVLSGTLYVGFGWAEDDAGMVAVPAGAVYVAPANQPHYLSARDGEVVYQEGGVGPTGMTFASPAPAPAPAPTAEPEADAEREPDVRTWRTP